MNLQVIRTAVKQRVTWEVYWQGLRVGYIKSSGSLWHASDWNRCHIGLFKSKELAIKAILKAYRALLETSKKKESVAFTFYKRTKRLASTTKAE